MEGLHLTCFCGWMACGVQTILTGSFGDEDLELMAQVAGAWARVNREGMLIDLQAEVLSGRAAALLGKDRNLHINMVNHREGFSAPRFYAPAMGVAVASLLSRRMPLQHIAVLGEITSNDYFTSSHPVVSRELHVELLHKQGFRRVVVARRVDVQEDMEDLFFGDYGMELWVDEQEGATFTTALPNIFGLPTPEREPQANEEGS